MARDFDDDDDDDAQFDEGPVPEDPKAGGKREEKPKDPAPRRPPGPPIIFVGLQFMAVAATIGALLFLTLALSRYDWQLPG
jgi:hypothetical protein